MILRERGNRTPEGNASWGTSRLSLLTKYYTGDKKERWAELVARMGAGEVDIYVSGGQAQAAETSWKI